MQQVYKIFDATTVDLANANLIEASAGTGKTYSIAILVLRLLLEKEIPIQEILMVTFTKAAVSELQDRIRKFVRDAQRYVNGSAISDDTIIKLVEKQDSEKAKRLLKAALIDLDEISVLTIHSFCQQTLNEFAFETGQLFGSELVQDVSEILNQEIQKFWRENITGIQTDLLQFLIGQGFNQDTIAKLLKGHLAGKSYIFYDAAEQYDFNETRQTTFYQKIAERKKALDAANSELTDFIRSKTDLATLCEKNTYARKALLPLVDRPEKFAGALKEKSEKDYAKKLFPQAVEKIEEIKKLEEVHKNEVSVCNDYLYAFTIQKIAKSVEERKVLASQFSFDDLIGKLHEALLQDDLGDLKRGLREKYKAVFIDEFQDTDKLQFEIFKWAFQENKETILFYIGDPKQSIYSFRTADIATYFCARKSVRENLFTMTRNFRSDPRLVEAMNKFFLPDDDFDTFEFADEPEKIEYVQVEGTCKPDQTLLLGGQPQTPITISFHKTQPEIFQTLAQDIVDLLNNPDATVYDDVLKDHRRILPSDIGILVRSKAKGLEAKKALNLRGVPAVITSDEKVLESPDAADMVYVLEACADPKIANIHRALMALFTRFSSEQIKTLDQENTALLFSNYQRTWSKAGIYTVLMQFAGDFEIRRNLIGQHAENGERILTNFYHLAEILHKTETRRHLTPDELITWLKLAIQKPEDAQDELEQRIESDEQAVKVTTIHKSKGLEYKVVFLPQINLKVDEKHDVLSFRDQDEKYKTGRKDQLTEGEMSLFRKQEEQENRRLTYVAVTRAKYKCFIYKSAGDKGLGSLDAFLTAIHYDNLIENRGEMNIDDARYQTDEYRPQTVLKASNFKLSGNNWRRMSYSGLAAEHERSHKEPYTAEEEDYDRFIFKDLRKGAKTGTFLHFIFENLDFHDSESWSKTILSAITNLDATRKDDEDYQETLHRFVSHVMNANLRADGISFKLSEVGKNQTLHELEFDFPVQEFYPHELEALENVGIGGQWTKKLQGLMNGKVDLFFQHGGKYYVLDWKSNYLGPNLEDYSVENLELAMSENNYHLQYLIYTLAVKKYLKSRLGNSFDFEKQFGGVFYLFVRGMRKGQNSGVFYRQISKEQIVTLERVLDSALLHTN